MAGEKAEDKAVGRIRGGLNTKLHAIVDGLGNPVKFLLSAGNDDDCVHAVELLENLELCGSNVLQTGLMVLDSFGNTSQSMGLIT